jgi:cytochrome bd-type quinol oxidase subunit 2
MSEIITRETRVDWAAIIAGAVVATAIGVILTTFGLGLGLAVNSTYEGEGSSPALFAIGAGLWLLLTQVAAFWSAAISAPASAHASLNSPNTKSTFATACTASSSGASASSQPG